MKQQAAFGYFALALLIASVGVLFVFLGDRLSLPWLVTLGQFVVMAGIIGGFVPWLIWVFLMARDFLSRRS